MKKMNLMMDLETLGTKPGCVILAIAAVPFNSKYDLEPFYMKISAASASAAGLTIDSKTQAWWESQSDAARDEAFSGTEDIKVALAQFDEYVHQLPDPPMIWGNGASFDNMILAEAYKICEMKQPWSFRDDMCYRTLKGMFPFIPFIAPALAHHALEDAKAQAAHANKIWAWMLQRGMVPADAT